MILRVILGDQLSHDMTSLSGIDRGCDVVLLCEVRNEAKRVPHHKKKIAFIFSAMRHFNAELLAAGVQTRYIQYEDPDNAGSFTGELKRAIEALKPERIVITEPSEFAVLEEVQGWQKHISLPVEIRHDDRFLCTKETFADWAKGRKQLRMEFFYREMRRTHWINSSESDWRSLATIRMRCSRGSLGCITHI